MKKVYEIIPPNFDGTSDKQDHLILWIAADSTEDIINIFPNFTPIELPEITIEHIAVDAII